MPLRDALLADSLATHAFEPLAQAPNVARQIMLGVDAADDVPLEPVRWERRRGGNPLQCGSQSGHVIVWHEKAAHSVLDRFGKTSVVGHDRGNAADHRFDRDQPERLGPSRRHHHRPG
jgi:hypothetical protein